MKLQKDPENNLAQLNTKINNLNVLIQQKEKQKNDLQTNLLNSNLDKKGKKNLLGQIEDQSEIINSLKDKLNCLLHVQTLTQQLQYIPNHKRVIEIEKISALLAQIDKGKINYNQAKDKYQIIQKTNSGNLYLPKSDCRLETTQDGKVIANQFIRLFNYTPQEIEKHYAEHDFLQAYTRLIKSNKKYFVEFKFEFSSPRANQLYGTIEESSPLKLSFLDDDFIYLLNAVTSPPEQQLSSGKTIYKMQCQINKSALKKLSKKDLNQLTVLWPSGAETYELNHLHVYKNLIECLQIKT